MVDVQVAIWTTFLGIIVAALFIYMYWSHACKKDKYSNDIFLIIGPNGSGKTALFFNLSRGDKLQALSTVSSIEPNFANIRLPLEDDKKKRKEFQIIDYPGHLKYKPMLNQLITEKLDSGHIKGFVYVIDSSPNYINEDSIKFVTKELFSLLTLVERDPKGKDVLIAINKQDLFGAMQVAKIRQMIESEMTKLIKYHLQEKSVGEDEDHFEPNSFETTRELWSSIVGTSSPKFSFDMLESRVSFLGGSVLRKNTKEWTSWVDENFS